MMRPFLYHENWRAIEALFDEMRIGLENETDYEHEAQNQRDIGRMFAGDGQMVVPRVFDEFSTGRVLTWVRQKPQNLFAHRLNFQIPALLFRLHSRVNMSDLIRAEDALNR